MIQLDKKRLGLRNKVWKMMMVSGVPDPVNDWFNAIMMTVNVFPVLTTVFPCLF